VLGLLFWNYFSRRSEKIYQNHHLPGRLAQIALSPQEHAKDAG
jgi:hypothetical protein